MHNEQEHKNHANISTIIAYYIYLKIQKREKKHLILIDSYLFYFYIICKILHFTLLVF